MGCGADFAAVIYFYTYLVLVNLIFMNLFIAVILEGYEENKASENRLFKVEARNLFTRVWSEFDPEASGFIPISDLVPFLFKLGAPLGWDSDILISKDF